MSYQGRIGYPGSLIDVCDGDTALALVISQMVHKHPDETVRPEIYERGQTYLAKKSHLDREVVKKVVRRGVKKGLIKDHGAPNASQGDQTRRYEIMPFVMDLWGRDQKPQVGKGRPKGVGIEIPRGGDQESLLPISESLHTTNVKTNDDVVVASLHPEPEVSAVGGKSEVWSDEKLMAIIEAFEPMTKTYDEKLPKILADLANPDRVLYGQRGIVTFAQNVCGGLDSFMADQDAREVEKTRQGSSKGRLVRSKTVRPCSDCALIFGKSGMHCFRHRDRHGNNIEIEGVTPSSTTAIHRPRFQKG